LISWSASLNGKSKALQTECEAFINSEALNLSKE